MVEVCSDGVVLVISAQKGGSCEPPTPGAPHGSLAGAELPPPYPPWLPPWLADRRRRRRRPAGRSGRGPRVVGRGRAGRPPLTLAAATEATATAGAVGAGDLGRGVLQRGTDFFDLDLEDGALLTLAGLVLTRLESALHDDAHAALQRLGDVLRRLAPHRAGEEQRIAVLPLVALLVERAGRRRDPEVRHRGTRGGEAELRVVDEVADDGDDRLACHVRSPLKSTDQ